MSKISATADHDACDMIQHERSIEDRLQRKGQRSVKMRLWKRAIEKHQFS